jgi:hypothetical protein
VPTEAALLEQHNVKKGSHHNGHPDQRERNEEGVSCHQPVPRTESHQLSRLKTPSVAVNLGRGGSRVSIRRMALWGAPSGKLAPDPLAGKRFREKVAIIPGAAANPSCRRLISNEPGKWQLKQRVIRSGLACSSKDRKLRRLPLRSAFDRWRRIIGRTGLA